MLASQLNITGQLKINARRKTSDFIQVSDHRIYATRKTFSKTTQIIRYSESNVLANYIFLVVFLIDEIKVLILVRNFVDHIARSFLYMISCSLQINS